MIKRLLYVIVTGVLAACGAQTDERPLPTLLMLDTLTPPTATPAMRTLEFWTPGEGQISAPGGVDIWTFTGQLGDNISLRAVGQGVTLSLTLFDPAGTELRQGESILTQLPQTGIFGVRVQAVDGTGGYAIGLGYSDRENPNAALPTMIPEVVGIPTPLPVTADLGRFITEISDGQTVGEEVANDDRQHVYVYRGTGGQYLNVALTRVSGALYPRLTLYSPDGLPLATDAESAGEASAVLRNVRLPQDGFYTLQTEISEGTGAYSLRLDAGDQPAPLEATPVIAPTLTPFAPDLRPTPEFVGNGAPLTDHKPVLAQLDREGAVMIHTFDAQVGDIITLSLKPEPNSALIPRLEIIDPEGIPAAASTGFQSPQNRAILLSGLVIETAGVHSVFVTGEGATWGAYTLAFGFGTTARTRMQGEAPVDRLVEGDLRDLATRDAWYLHLKRGDVITISVTPQDETTDTVLEVVDANGALLGIDNRTGSTRQPTINGLAIPGDGLYYLRVRAAVSEGVGAYGLSWRYLDVAPTPDAPRAVLPLVRLEDTVADSAYAFYPFYGQAGQRVRIRVIADEGLQFDPVAALLDPSAAVIAQGDDANGTLNPEFTATLPENGTYSIRVNGYLTGGRFTLLVEALF